MADDLPDHIRVAEDDAELKIATESLVGEVGAAYKRDTLIGGYELCVQRCP